MKYLKIFLTTVILNLTLGTVSAKTHNHTKHPAKTERKCTTHNLNGKATFYGSNYRYGRKTASGEIFDKNQLTAAHLTLPFGTVVLVTNTKNGKSVKVRITDRGPYGKGRIIDLSVAAFKEIATLNTGVVPVTVTIISMPTT